MTREERRIRTALLTHAADRARLELSVPVCMMWDCCFSVGEHPKAGPGELEFWKDVSTDLQLGALEPLAGLSLARWEAGRTLSVQVARWAMVDFTSRPVITMTMATLRMLEAMLNADVLELPEHSAMDRALGRILQELGNHEELAADVDRSATKLARHMFARLQSLGLYKDAQPFGRAAA
jgi:hypothetical protein